MRRMTQCGITVRLDRARLLGIPGLVAKANPAASTDTAVFELAVASAQQRRPVLSRVVRALPR